MNNNLGFLDNSLIQNSTLSCILLTYFIKEYENVASKTESPDLLKILLVLPLLWNKETCLTISKKKKKTSLFKVVSENPLINLNLDKRVSEFAAISIQGLNIASSCGLIFRRIDENDIIVCSNFDNWPRGYSLANVPPDMINAIKRLAFWFKNYSTDRLYSLLMGGN